MKLKTVTCRIARQELSLSTSADLPYAIQEHLADCPACATFAAGISRLDAALGLSTRDRPRPEVRDRIAEALVSAPARRAPAGRQSLRQLRWATGLVTACLAMGIGVGVHRHGRHIDGFQLYTGEAARAMEQVDDAIARVRTAYVVTYLADYKTDNDTVAHHFDTPQMVEEQWYEDHKWRKEGIWGSRLIVGHAVTYNGGQPEYGTYYRFDSRKKAVVSMSESGKQMDDFSFEGVTGLNAAGVQCQATTIDNREFEGHMAHEVEITMLGKADFRDLCWIDSATNLPISVELQTQLNGEWKTQSHQEFVFNQDLPSSLFDPSTLRDQGWSIPGEK